MKVILDDIALFLLLITLIWRENQHAVLILQTQLKTHHIKERIVLLNLI